MYIMHKNIFLLIYRMWILGGFVILFLFTACGSKSDTHREETQNTVPLSTMPDYQTGRIVPKGEGLVYIRFIHQIDGLPTRIFIESLGDGGAFYGWFRPHPQTEKACWHLPQGNYSISNVFYEQLYADVLETKDTADYFIPNEFKVDAGKSYYLGDLFFMDDRPASLGRSDPIHVLEIQVELQDNYAEAQEEFFLHYPEAASKYGLERQLLSFSDDRILRLEYKGEPQPAQEKQIPMP